MRCIFEGGGGRGSLGPGPAVIRRGSRTLSRWVPKTGPRFWALLPLCDDASPECERVLLGVGIRGSSTLLLADRAGLKNRVGKKDKMRGGEWGFQQS